MSLDEALRREVDQVPPIGIDEVRARAAERPPSTTRRWPVPALAAAVAVLVVAVAALAVRSGDDEDRVAATADETTTSTTEPETAETAAETATTQATVGADTTTTGPADTASDPQPGPTATTTATTDPPPPPSTTTTTVPPVNSSGLRVEVAVAGTTNIGPIVATVGAIGDTATYGSANPYDADQQHVLLLTNTGDVPVYLDDSRTSNGVGDPPGIFVGTDGCGVAIAQDGTPSSACLMYYRPLSIEPGQTFTYNMSVWLDLPTYAPSDQFTTGTFELPLRWRTTGPYGLDHAPVDDEHAGQVQLRYFR